MDFVTFIRIYVFISYNSDSFRISVNISVTQVYKLIILSYWAILFVDFLFGHLKWAFKGVGINCMKLHHLPQHNSQWSTKSIWIDFEHILKLRMFSYCNIN